MQSRDVNPGSPALGPAFLMTLSPGSEERVRRGAVHNGTLPRERRFFRDAETVKRGTKQSPPLCPTAKPWSCAHLLLSLFQPPLSCLFVTSPFLLGDEDSWLASSPCCLLHLPLTLAPGPFSSPRLSLFLACLGDLVHVTTWVLSMLTLSVTLCGSSTQEAPSSVPFSSLRYCLGKGQHEGWDRMAVLKSGSSLT